MQNQTWIAFFAIWARSRELDATLTSTFEGLGFPDVLVTIMTVSVVARIRKSKKKPSNFVEANNATVKMVGSIVDRRQLILLSFKNELAYWTSISSIAICQMLLRSVTNITFFDSVCHSSNRRSCYHRRRTRTRNRNNNNKKRWCKEDVRCTA